MSEEYVRIKNNTRYSSNICKIAENKKMHNRPITFAITQTTMLYDILKNMRWSTFFKKIMLLKKKKSFCL